ncbi:hypothetical protein Tco_0002318 [Tanacetum coccineum]
MTDVITSSTLQGIPNSYAGWYFRELRVKLQEHERCPIHIVNTHNAAIKSMNLDVYDSDCDEISTAKAVLMANLSSYGLDVLSEVPHFDNTNNEMLNQSVQEIPYSEQPHLVNYPENKITSDSNIILYS